MDAHHPFRSPFYFDATGQAYVVSDYGDLVMVDDESETPTRIIMMFLLMGQFADAKSFLSDRLQITFEVRRQIDALKAERELLISLVQKVAASS